MLMNGEKWACETCIKGHRATHCKHTDRKLVLVKKKGRPSTQCKRCKELRVMHGKIQTPTKRHVTTNLNTPPVIRKKQSETLRPIAPKQKETVTSCCGNKYPSPKPNHQSVSPPPLPTVLQPSVSLSIPISLKPSTQPTLLASMSSSTPVQSTLIPPIHPVTTSNSNPKSSCCSKKTSSDPPQNSQSESVPLPHIPPPTSCCGPPSKNQQGEIIRVVTCRCGDSCACIGCDAHPSRAMKDEKSDVYIGFDSKKRLSISSIVLSKNDQIQQEPSSVLIENGVSFCGCGCSKTFEECSGCFQGFLCQDYH
ncbi:hypothetical protein A0J61_06844 [Choanephora cucurbitarum]|uniref:Copper-fist domain-containing protein n=1 Tax=Choanephora cucurbitarum TaxID=101091 RepID=A0A1C7N7L9_9FUNG|nr:hypothetical protein A0J61_06844 [Choanephora cucurbitarum]